MSAHDRCLPAAVGEAMIHHPKVWSADVTVADLRRAFDDDHLHAALVVDGGRLLAVVTREDIATSPAADLARRYGHLRERVIDLDDDLARVWTGMARAGIRRPAVVDDESALLGLLCLKRSGRGFCSDADVAARAAERHQMSSCAAPSPSVPGPCSAA